MSTIEHSILAQFQVHLTELQSQHRTLQANDREMRARQAQRCRISLENAVKSLLEVVALVRKHDKRLVAWHTRSSGLKKALRFVGIDRRTERTLEKTTQRLKDGVQQVEEKFEHTGGLFEEGIDNAKSMQQNFSHIGHRGVEENLQAMRHAEASFKQELQRIDSQIQHQGFECSGASAELQHQMERLQELTDDHAAARRTTTAWGVGVLAATVGIYAMPFVAIPVGLAMGYKAIMSSAEQEELRKQKEEHERLVDEHDSGLKALKLKLSKTTHDHEACSAYLEQIKQIEAKNRAIRLESFQALDLLRGVRISLEDARQKIAAISQELQECQYETTRRGLADRLKSILQTIIQVSAKAKLKDIDQKLITKVTDEICAVSGATVKVMAIVAELPQ